MEEINRRRMIRLAEEFFDAKSDPDQISVTEEDIHRLLAIDPATMSEESSLEGPVAWVLVIPTLRQVMEPFLAGELSERELLAATPIGASYDAVYLCSALVLPEFRGQGLARRLTRKAIQSIQQRHSITTLFFWAFSEAGEKLAASLAGELHLKLYGRKV